MDIFISTDVETNGPIPGPFSMLNFGSVALNQNKDILSTFEVNLTELPGASEDPDTMLFWSKNKTVWGLIRQNQKNPKEAMVDYLNWLTGLAQQGNLIFVAYPTGFDFSFIRWYLINFTGECPFDYNALDIRSYASGKLNIPFSKANKKNFKPEWFDCSLPHTHSGLDDALAQGIMFINMLNYN